MSGSLDEALDNMQSNPEQYALLFYVVFVLELRWEFQIFRDFA
jgi:hypothetical protein